MNKKTKQQPRSKKKTRASQKKTRQPRTPKSPKSDEQRRAEKVMSIAHQFLTKTIDPAKLSLEEVVDVLALVAKAVVLSNTEEDDLEDRSEMIGWIEERFMEVLDVIDPGHAFDEPVHAWLVSPQGTITEPIGIVWSGSHEDAGGNVQVVLGAELEKLRAEIAEDQAGVIVIEGVEGVAAIDPEWDGEPTMTCANPQCGKVHNVHLSVAESLFQQAIERRMSPPN